MKTQTELVCQYHFGDYHAEEMVRRNKTPVDISPLTNPIDGLCLFKKGLETLFEPDHHDKTILAVTWEI